MVDKNILNDDLIAVDDDDFDDFEVIDVNEIKDRIASMYVEQLKDEKDQENNNKKVEEYTLYFLNGVKGGTCSAIIILLTFCLGDCFFACLSCSLGYHAGR